MRRILAKWLLGLGVCLSPLIAAGFGTDFEITILDSALSAPTAAVTSSGALDAHFAPFTAAEARKNKGNFWLKIKSTEAFAPAGMAVLKIHKGRQSQVQVFARASLAQPLQRVAELPEYRGAHEEIFALMNGLSVGQTFYVQVSLHAIGPEELRFSKSTLNESLARAAEHTRMIALCFGALVAVSLSALLIWILLADRVFILYSILFTLQALYIVYLSGQGFSWPVLAYALPLNSFAWNVPAAISGAIACLLARDVADLQRYAPRIFRVMGGFAAAFALLTIANLVKLIGFSAVVNMTGNILFIACAIFTLFGVFLAWRRGSRAAGWFLIAWGLLEAFTITSAIRLIFFANADADRVLNYYGLPLSMVAAAILIALGVADRLRAQRLALTDAERRAQTDALTGVLNRRSLLERLEAACSRARARGLPIALLFIDLDHFKNINDSYGHQAGDACLRAIIEPIHAELRQSDVIGRYGGEEFVVILSSADSAAAHPIAQRILDRVAEVRVDGFGNPIRLTCSIGVAASDTLGVWGEHLIAHADAAVYVAKRSGRNQVQIALPLAA